MSVPQPEFRASSGVSADEQVAGRGLSAADDPGRRGLSRTTIGLAAGLFIGAVGAIGGWAAFFIVLLCGAAGLVVGMVLDGRIDVASLIGRVTERR